jgi:hypothetical protein
MRKKDLYTLIGFVVFATGLTSIIFNIVGVEWYLLQWMNLLNPLFSFMLKLLMIVGGMVIIYLNKVNWRENN